MPDFNYDNLNAIALALDRYERVTGKKLNRKRMARSMDLAAADGVNGNNPINWEQLETADDFTLVHDIGGIIQHIDRQTGQMLDCFVPRCTRRVA